MPIFVRPKKTASSVERAELHVSNNFDTPMFYVKEIRFLKHVFVISTTGLLNCGARNREKKRNPHFFCLSVGAHAGSPTLWVYELLKTYLGNYAQKIKEWIVESQRFCGKSSAPFLEFSIFWQTVSFWMRNMPKRFPKSHQRTFSDPFS